ncbi:MAG: EAL domain-containing protein [Geminicoccaceae bacterium]|nr:EAL domain-containing protein [Geminicoccaceae bacterium]
MRPVFAARRAQASLLARYSAELARRHERTLASFAVERAKTIAGLDAQFQAIVQQAFDAILLFGSELGVRLANRAAALLLGRRAPDDLADLPLRALVPSRADLDEGALRARTGRFETEFRRADGTLVPVEMALAVLTVEGETMLLSTARDTSERRRQEARLRHQATHDDLTGLANRARLYEVLEQDLARAVEGGSELALLLIDLDRFKEVNDTLGHEAGDRLLRLVAARLRERLGPEDLAARLSGDEFAVVLRPPCSCERATRVAQSILEAVQRPFQLADELSVEVEASLGIAIGPMHARDARELVRCADAGLYAAERGSGAIELYDQSTDPHSLRRLVAVTSMRRALREQQLTLFYQPKFDLRCGRIVGCEALLRWDHPEYGPIPPSEFVPLAEQTGSVVALTRWTISTALAELAQWRVAGSQVGVAVNLAARALFDDELPSHVAETLHQHDLGPELLTFELTETSLLVESPIVERVLAALREIGIRFSIDDFGVGYSSLALLQKLGAHELKIDRSFVAAEPGSRQRVLVRNTIRLAHDLGIVAVAEGIETVEQLRAMQSAGCDLGQGYLLGKVISAERFARLLAAERARNAA